MGKPPTYMSVYRQQIADQHRLKFRSAAHPVHTSKVDRYTSDILTNEE